MKFLLKWLVATLAVIITAYLLPGIAITDIFAALVAALILGLLNAILKPVLVILTLPINVLTLGLFTLVINAALVMLTGAIVPGFKVAGFLWALLFSLVLSIIMFVLGKITKD
ncbi:MAG: phage holin family protein [Candidatus Buchananbacteria bacterium]|jgi:putative membrane protein